jgi:carbonic anhydrase
MPPSMGAPLTRRGLLRLGMLASVGTAVLPSFYADEALAEAPKPGCEYCNVERPGTPTGALQALIDGNNRWARNEPVHPGEDADRRRCAANVSCPQTPFAAILSCVDSRVPPELLFDQGIGDLFIGRVAGNSVVPILEDSLNYGTHHLGALLLFVLGHSSCGAVDAATDSYLHNPSHPKPHFAFEPPIYPAVAAARSIILNRGGNPNDPRQVAPVAINQHVRQTVRCLASIQPFKELIHHGKLLVTSGQRRPLRSEHAESGGFGLAARVPHIARVAGFSFETRKPRLGGAKPVKPYRPQLTENRAKCPCI